MSKDRRYDPTDDAMVQKAFVFLVYLNMVVVLEIYVYVHYTMEGLVNEIGLVTNALVVVGLQAEVVLGTYLEVVVLERSKGLGLKVVGQIVDAAIAVSSRRVIAVEKKAFIENVVESN